KLILQLNKKLAKYTSLKKTILNSLKKLNCKNIKFENNYLSFTYSYVCLLLNKQKEKNQINFHFSEQPAGWRNAVSLEFKKKAKPLVKEIKDLIENK
ncbi:hypothetical protein KA107_01405, partial [Candidatus Pacearchaeota archaeon]|nr:hypothetical protein [Candidatus Pacearchaeota archaeon]